MGLRSECLLLAMARWLDGSWLDGSTIFPTHAGVAYKEHKHASLHKHTSMSGRLHTKPMRSHKSVKVMSGILQDEYPILLGVHVIYNLTLLS